MPPKRKTASPKVGSTVRKTTDFPPPPMWPPLEPLVPTQDLALENLLDNQIVLIRKLFTSTLCRKYVSFFESLPLMTTPAKPKAGEAVRVNDRIQYDDYVFAQQLWEKTSLQSLLSESAEPGEPDSVSSKDAGRRWGGDLCGLNPRVRIYKYSENQFFAPHYDESNLFNLPTNPPTPVKTTWTLLIYLTGQSTGCVGGETVFYPELGPAKHLSNKSSESTQSISVEPEVGMALLHKHGQECLLHEGKKVTKGAKWVIRSDICVRR